MQCHVRRFELPVSRPSVRRCSPAGGGRIAAVFSRPWIWRARKWRAGCATLEGVLLDLVARLKDKDVRSTTVMDSPTCCWRGTGSRRSGTRTTKSPRRGPLGPGEGGKRALFRSARRCNSDSPRAVAQRLSQARRLCAGQRRQRSSPATNSTCWRCWCAAIAAAGLGPVPRFLLGAGAGRLASSRRSAPRLCPASRPRGASAALLRSRRGAPSSSSSSRRVG